MKLKIGLVLGLIFIITIISAIFFLIIQNFTDQSVKKEQPALITINNNLPKINSNEELSKTDNYKIL